MRDRSDEQPHGTYREYVGACCGTCDHRAWASDEQLHCGRLIGESESANYEPVIHDNGICDLYKGPARRMA